MDEQKRFARGGIVPGKSRFRVEPDDGGCYIPLARDSARSRRILDEMIRRMEGGSDG